MAYKHGAFANINASQTKSATKMNEAPVFVGAMPIDNVEGWQDKDLIHRPIVINSLKEAKEKLGFDESADLSKFPTCEVIDFFFNNSVKPIAPVIIINEYDPAKAAEDENYKVTAQDVIGTYDASKGEYTGIQALRRVYPELLMIPALVAAPGYSDDSSVAAAISAICQKLNGHFYTFGLVDLPLTAQSIDEAIQHKEDKGLKFEFCKGYWPQWKVTSTDKVYHLSTIGAWRYMCNDAENDDIPMRTDSNCDIPAGVQYFGEDSTNKGFDQETANQLNQNGIATAINWAGRSVIWGGHTLGFKYGADQDARAIFDTNMRIMIYVANWFQTTFASKIDDGLTRALKDSILIEYQAKLDALKAMGAFVGVAEVSFNAEENADEDIINGDFVWATKLTPTPQLKSATNNIVMTDEGYESLKSE